MKYGCKPLALALTFASIVTPAVAAPDAVALKRLLTGPGLDLALSARLYREAVLDDQGVQGLYARLGQLAASDAAAPERARALLARASMRWRQGDLVQALADVDQALALAPGPDGWRLKASLLDAQGDGTAALAWYRKAAEATAQVGEREVLQRRLALLDARNSAAALRAMARHGTPAGNRTAVVLALLSHPDDALALYTIQGQGASTYPEYVQAADWAIMAGRHAQAREQAWAAFGVAANALDRRYALALLMESYRDAGALPEAVTFLASRSANPEVVQARVDALLELQRYDEAIALVRASAHPQLRRRLIGILELAGRREEIVAEYRRLIQAQPHSPASYDGLAALYMGEDKPAQALEVYRTLFANNHGRVDLLIPAARQMSAMGLHAQAVQLLGQAGGGEAMAIAVDFFLFDTYLDQGRDALAAQALARLRQRLPAADPRRIELADDYERQQRPDQALAVLTEMEHRRTKPLDYDLQVHMADLALKAGQGGQALVRLRRLWEQTQLPARRGFLEQRIVQVAQSQGQLDKIAAGLDARLAAGTAQRSEVGLLVVIRLAQHNHQAAAAAVARYAAAGGDSLQRLRQLSDFYLRLHDGARLDQTLRQLAQADPDNADLYLRKLVINTLRQPAGDAGGVPETSAQQQARVTQLIGQLQAASGHGGAEASRFAAGVYALAGMDQRAIAQYRRAMAQAPQDVDSLLQLAEQLRKSGRMAAAVTMLQAVAEYATDQKTFVLAIDGLVGLFAVNDGDRRRQDEAARLAVKALPWAQRQVLERIAGSDEVYPLYSLLADIGLSQTDAELQARAYENALALAGDQRPLILRQLVGLDSNAGNGTGPVLSDDHRKIRFGRRLIALRREFPPDFYADLARSLLASGDALGAERAFSVMTDVGGLVDLPRIKGDAYAAQGYVQQALLNYGQALARDQDDPALVLKTAILRERQGQFAIAHPWYWRALHDLILRQPLHDGGLMVDAGLDVQRYSPSLVEGLLLTWPDGREQEAMAGLRQLFDETLAQADPAQPLAHQPRLRMIVQLQWRIAESRRDFAQADAFDAALAHTFADDPQQRSEAAYHHRLTARAPLQPALATAADGDWVMQALQAQAGQTGNAGNPPLALALTVSSGDAVQIEALMRQALQAEQDRRAAVAGQAAADFAPDTLYQLLAQGVEHLPEDLFRRALYAPLQAAPFRDEVLFNFYRGSPERYAELERMLGEPPLADDVLIRMLAEHGNDPMPYRAPPRDPHARGGGGLDGAMFSRFSLDQQITLYDALVGEMAKGGAPSMLQSLLLKRLLQQPLNAGQQARIADIAAREIQAQPGDRARTAASMAPGLLVFDADSGNRALLLQLAERVAATYPDGGPLPAFYRAYFAGERDAAMARLQVFLEDIGTADSTLTGLVRQYFPEQRQRRIDAFLASDAPSQAQIDAFYRDFVLAAVNGIQPPDHAALARYYRKLSSLQPDNPTYLAGLLDLHLRARDTAAFIADLRGYVQRHPDDMQATVTLALAYRLAKQPQQAQAVAQAGDVDIGDVNLIVRMIGRATAPRRGTYVPDFGNLFLQVYDAYRSAQPDAPVVLAGHQRQHPGAAQPVLAEAGLQPLASAFAHQPERAAGVLRGLWRNSAIAPEQRQQLLMTRFDLQGRPLDMARSRAPADGDQDQAEAAPDLLAALAARPVIGDEYERYLRALPAESRRREQRLYDLLAQGLIAQGRGDERTAQLQSRLMAGQIDAHELQLLATLSIQQGWVFSPEQCRALVAWLQVFPDLIPRQCELLARVFADAHDDATATRLLEAAVMQLLYPAGPDSPDYAPSFGPGDPIVELMENLGQWQDREAARRAYARLQRLLEEQRGATQIRLPQLLAPAWLGHDRMDAGKSSK